MDQRSTVVEEIQPLLSLKQNKTSLFPISRIGRIREIAPLCAVVLAMMPGGLSRAQTAGSAARQAQAKTDSFQGLKDQKMIGKIIRIETGLIQGIMEEETVTFLGVPYAAPPIGPLRWVAPQRAARWNGVRDAAKSAPAAAQGTSDKPMENSSEDCLYLNIRAPRAVSKSSKKPVMVWLHGGGFSSGSANSYDARRMVAQGDVIVVAVEFRLNIFGYFGYPGLEGSGTFGLQDQQAALRWVKRNIAAFGGDPGNITLFGESGGSIATCAQLVSPGAKGLIHKAILQSGATTTSWPINTPNMTKATPHGTFWRPLKEVEAAGKDLSARLCCSGEKGPKAALECLRKLPTAKLLAYTTEFATAAYGSQTLPQDPAQALSSGHFSAVPVLSGCTRNEARGMASGMQLMAGGQPMTEEEYQKLLIDAFGAHKAEVEAHYPRSNYATPALAWSAIYTDRMFVCPQFVAARALAKRVPVYAYEFADPHSPGLIPFLPGFPSGASHSGELPFLFEVENAMLDLTTGKSIPLSQEQKTLAGTMIRYWTHFAHHGNPNGEGLPHWPRFESAKPYVQVLASGAGGIETQDNVPESHQCEFWSKFLK